MTNIPLLRLNDVKQEVINKFRNKFNLPNSLKDEEILHKAIVKQLFSIDVDDPYKYFTGESSETISDDFDEDIDFSEIPARYINKTIDNYDIYDQTQKRVVNIVMNGLEKIFEDHGIFGLCGPVNRGKNHLIYASLKTLIEKGYEVTVYSEADALDMKNMFGQVLYIHDLGSVIEPWNRKKLESRLIDQVNQKHFVLIFRSSDKLSELKMKYPKLAGGFVLRTMWPEWTAYGKQN